MGDDFATELVKRYPMQVLLIIQQSQADTIGSKAEENGVFVLTKPINRHILNSMILMMETVQSRIRALQGQNDTLRQKIEDIKIIDRAKYLLITYLKLTENEAHKYIERHAMNQRVTRRDIAKNIISTYEDLSLM
jgi:response regulator NasT